MLFSVVPMQDDTVAIWSLRQRMQRK
jgi:hypothetical protein